MLPIAVFAFLMGSAGTAAAQDGLAFLARADCGVDGRIAPDDWFQAVLSDTGTAMDLDAARLWDSHGFGDAAVADGSPFTTARLRAQVLATHFAGRTSPDGITIQVGAGAPADGRERARLILNNAAPWFTIGCRPATVQTAEETGETGGRRRQAEGSSWIVGASADDAAREDLASGGFAKVSYTDDRQAGEEIVAVELYVGSPAFETGLVGPWRSYLSYQRTTPETDPVNDLALGLQFERLGRFGLVYGALSYETDDEFESALYRGDLTWAPGWILPCEGEAGAYRFKCRPTFSADYVSVGDAGEKVSLTDQEEYARIGGGLELGVARALPNGGVVEASLTYRLMEALDGDAGDASELRGGFKLLPAEDANFTVGLEFVDGEDPTSLTPQDKIMVYFGYRR